MELLGSHSCLCAEGFSGAACESKRFFYHYGELWILRRGFS